MTCIIIVLGYFINIIKNNLEKYINTLLVTVDMSHTCASYNTLDEINYNTRRGFVTPPEDTPHTRVIEIFNKDVTFLWVQHSMCITFH